MCNIKWLWKSQTALKGQTSNTNGSKNQPKKLELKTMKGLDTVESLSAGAARDPNRNMYGNRNNYLHFCDIHSFQY